MQHAFTIDLEGLNLDCERARGMRAVAVFIDSLYELEPGSRGISVVWLDQAQIDATPQPDPPEDFVGEMFPGLCPEGDYVSWPVLSISTFDDGSPQIRDSYIGGEPVWGEVEAPSDLPGGSFVLAVAYEWGRGDASLLVFEEGGVMHPQFEWESGPSWSEAIDSSRRLEVLEEAPASDSVQKWGGIPRGVTDWPQGQRHILTWTPAEPIDDIVAYALFGATGDDAPEERYTVVEIYEDDLDDGASEDLEIPAGVEVLQERALSFVPLEGGLGWRDLQGASFVGPRAAWRAPDRRDLPELEEGPVLQIEGTRLPGENVSGTLYIHGGSLMWQDDGPGLKDRQAGEPEEADGFHDDEDIDDVHVGGAVAVGWVVELPKNVGVAELESVVKATLEGMTVLASGEEQDGGRRVVLGRGIAYVDASDPSPTAVDPEAVASALSNLPTLDPSAWDEVLGPREGWSVTDAPGAYLLSWGPLCFAAVSVGVVSTNVQTTYKRIANQDTRQEWSSSWVDGVSVAHVEFGGIEPVRFAAEQLDKVSGHRTPGYWLTCRYD